MVVVASGASFFLLPLLLSLVLPAVALVVVASAGSFFLLPLLLSLVITEAVYEKSI